MLVEHGGEGGHFEVFGVGDEAAAVTPSTAADGEGDHVASFELEAAYAVVELGGTQRVHVTAGVLQSEVIDRLAAEVLF